MGCNVDEVRLCSKMLDTSSHVEEMKPLDLEHGLRLEYRDSTGCLTHSCLDWGSAPVRSTPGLLEQ